MSDRLIDADKLVKALTHHWDRYPLKKQELMATLDIISTMPEAVVRCKDCKYRRVSEKGLFKSGYFCERCHIDSFMKDCDDWFCADGERRENAD